MTHNELVTRAQRWLRNPARKGAWHKMGCGVVVPELVSYASEQPDAVGWIAGGYSYLIECKTSRADFFADLQKPRHQPGGSGIGAECFYLCVPGIVPVDRLPYGWGLLHCHPRMTTIEALPSGNLTRNRDAELAMMYSLLRRVEVRGHLQSCLSKKWGGTRPPIDHPLIAEAS